MEHGNVWKMNFNDNERLAILFDKWIVHQPHVKMWLEYEHRHYMSGKSGEQIEKAQAKQIASQNLHNYV